MKKVVIFGGGSGLSQLLKGLKEFPLDITAVVSTIDNGSSTGRLRKEFSIPAVGDITKVLLAMSTTSKGVKDLLNYRFDDNSSLGNHTIRNLIMTALLEQHKDFAHSLPVLCDLLDVKGELLPLTEDNADLIGISKNGEIIYGEERITKSAAVIEDVKYSKDITVNPKVLKAIKKADLIIFSSGSLLTSILPSIILPEMIDAINNAKAKKMYICNMLTQPGETDNYKVSDHLKVIEKHLGKGSIDVVIANSEKMPQKAELLAKSQGKDAVPIDEKEIKNMGIKLISEKLFKIDEGFVRHNALKTAYLIFSYLIEGE